MRYEGRDPKAEGRTDFSKQTLLQNQQKGQSNSPMHICVFKEYIHLCATFYVHFLKLNNSCILIQGGSRVWILIRILTPYMVRNEGER